MWAGRRGPTADGGGSNSKRASPVSLPPLAPWIRAKPTPSSNSGTGLGTGLRGDGDRVGFKVRSDPEAAEAGGREPSRLVSVGWERGQGGS